MTIEEAEEAVGPEVFHKLRQASTGANCHLMADVRWFVRHLFIHNKTYYERLLVAIQSAANTGQWVEFGKWFYGNGWTYEGK